MKQVISTERIPIKMWLENIEDEALQQAKNLANLPFAAKHIALMPDSHSGYGMPIGGVLATNGVIVPNAVGVDIGCGMCAVSTTLTEIDTEALKQIMGQIREWIPLGFNHHEEAQAWAGFDKAPDLPVIQRELTSARKQLGTLGGGNHFIEIQKGSDGYIWLMLHSGSRNFGLKVANEYHKKALFLTEKWYSNIPDKDLAFLPIETKEGKEYLEAMNYCLDFAKASRARIMDMIMGIVWDLTGATCAFNLDVHHNYAVFEHHFGRDFIVHRKGAVRARVGEASIIPGSMGSHSYIVKGLGNPDSFTSSSHGAGRRMGRKQAIRTLDLATEQAKMVGIVHGLRASSDLDEAPGSYKDIDEVMANQADLVEIEITLTPLASIKG
jgi:tRNA-splicing ligase RtcB